MYIRVDYHHIRRNAYRHIHRTRSLLQTKYPPVCDCIRQSVHVFVRRGFADALLLSFDTNLAPRPLTKPQVQRELLATFHGLTRV